MSSAALRKIAAQIARASESAWLIQVSGPAGAVEHPDHRDALISFSLFSFTLKGFFSLDNLLSLTQSVSILGILALGMGVPVIGLGIGLCMVTTMVMSTARVFHLSGDGVSLPLAIAAGFGFAVVVGFLAGVSVAYVEVPSLSATLALSSGVILLIAIVADAIFNPRDEQTSQQGDI